MYVAFGEEPKDDDLERDRLLLPLDRILAAWDGGRPVGLTASYAFELTIHGGSAPAAGVTAVGVLPSHRRRGILRELMLRQLEDVHSRGEPLAILWASESLIYGRFGYGIAALQTSIDAERSAFALRDDPGARGSVRLVTKDEAAELFPPLYESHRLEQPGRLSRSEVRWKHGAPAGSRALAGRRRAEELRPARDRRHPRRFRHVSAGVEVGGRRATRGAPRAGGVRRLPGGDGRALAVPVRRRPRGARQVQPHRSLALPHDDRPEAASRLDLRRPVAAARRRRGGASSAPFRGAGRGRARSRRRRPATKRRPLCSGHVHGPDRCGGRTSRSHVADLASAYLGAFSFERLAAAGRARELRPGGLARATALFSTPIPPYCPEGF